MNHQSNPCTGGLGKEHLLQNFKCRRFKDPIRDRSKRRDGNTFCEHGGRKSRCIICKAALHCEHGKDTLECNECKKLLVLDRERLAKRFAIRKPELNYRVIHSNKRCEHGREKSKCKECKGGSICEHDRERSKCKDCKGGSICEHGRERAKCKDCKGGSICDHGRERSKCIDCQGGSICEHGRVRSTCKVHAHVAAFIFCLWQTRLCSLLQAATHVLTRVLVDASASRSASTDPASGAGPSPLRPAGRAPRRRIGKAPTRPATRPS